VPPGFAKAEGLGTPYIESLEPFVKSDMMNVDSWKPFAEATYSIAAIKSDTHGQDNWLSGTHNKDPTTCSDPSH
jgi:hypothetical protein